MRSDHRVCRSDATLVACFGHRTGSAAIAARLRAAGLRRACEAAAIIAIGASPRRGVGTLKTHIRLEMSATSVACALHRLD